MTNDMEKVIARIEKLLALSKNNPNEAEAAAAAAKAQEMLEAYNLDMAVLGTSGKGAQRSDTKRTGGLYSWQRKLWKSVAELNFCYYFSLKGLEKGSVYEHRLVGSKANVISTEMMATYLQETIEKLAQKWAKSEGYNSVFVREAIAYREGMTHRVCEKLQHRRDEQIRKAREEEEERKRDQARNASASTSTALSVIDIASSEADFNNDYLNGWEMGTTAANRAKAKAEEAARMAAYKEQQRIHAERYANDPDYKAAYDKQKKEQDEWWADYMKKAAKKASRRKEPAPRYRRPTAEEERMGTWAFREGRQDGDAVGIDTQVNEKAKRSLK